MHGFETNICFAITPLVASVASLWFVPSAQVQNRRHLYVSSRIRDRPNRAEIEPADIVDGDGEADARAGKNAAKGLSREEMSEAN